MAFFKNLYYLVCQFIFIISYYNIYIGESILSLSFEWHIKIHFITFDFYFIIIIKICLKYIITRPVFGYTYL